MYPYDALLLATLLLLALGLDLMWGGSSRQGQWDLAAPGALVLLALGYTGALRHHRRRRLLASVVTAVNGLAVVVLGGGAINVAVFQYYWVNYPPSRNEAGAAAVRGAWVLVGAGVVLWAAVNLLVITWLGWSTRQEMIVPKPQPPQETQ